MVSTFEERHRSRKRKIEMDMAVSRIMPFLQGKVSPDILEFGSGNGYQIPYLDKLGRLVASDIYESGEIAQKYPDVRFVTCDIGKTPFDRNSFDLVFSNHVLEHIKEIDAAFSELKRIGRDGCIYVFTVPTALWLLLSLPAQCYNAVRKVFDKGYKKGDAARGAKEKKEYIGLERFLPRGHGWRKSFFACLSSFRIAEWERLFRSSGFAVMERAPLLLYAPSEFPIIPTTGRFARFGLCSSAIFILRKA